ncbi:MAG: aldehyde dehydrogenase family protein [Gemmatimonas sp.]|nr:aldehyde dehydrogenase family protein [Gemmatimonas sp.]
MPMQSVNPATGEVLEEFEPDRPERIEEKLARAWAAYGEHRATPFADRSQRMMRAAEILEEEKGQFARMMTEEMGKPIGAAVAEAEKCAWACRFYAENAERMLADEEVETSARRSFVKYLPVGPVLAVMPWNFPFWQVFRFAAPALMAGNVGLLKHASNVPRCATAIEDIFRRAGFVVGAFQALLIDSGAVAAVLDDPRVRAATLTGSNSAGAAIAERAGRRIKKTVLELGGSDPFIVMPSAKLESAISTAVTARTINNGESCIAAKRFIVHEAVYDRFVDGLVKGLEGLELGDPLDEQTQIGPLATPAIAEELDDQVRRTVAAGARVLTGGRRLDGPGNFYLPTVLSDIPPGSPAACEELFGPVAAVFEVGGLDEAIALANDSIYGLGCSVWTQEEEERTRFINEIETGLIFVNAMVASDPRLPFGGVKESGYGRELGVWGIREFVNAKAVWIAGDG